VHLSASSTTFGFRCGPRRPASRARRRAAGRILLRSLGDDHVDLSASRPLSRSPTPSMRCANHRAGSPLRQGMITSHRRRRREGEAVSPSRGRRTNQLGRTANGPSRSCCWRRCRPAGRLCVKLPSTRADHRRAQQARGGGVQHAARDHEARALLSSAAVRTTGLTHAETRSRTKKRRPQSAFPATVDYLRETSARSRCAPSRPARPVTNANPLGSPSRSRTAGRPAKRAPRMSLQCIPVLFSSPAALWGSGLVASWAP